MTPLLFLVLASLQPAIGSLPSCKLNIRDSGWLSRSVSAWDLTRRAALDVPPPASLSAVVFDGACVLSSKTAMIGGANLWSASPIVGGKVQVGSEAISTGVISAAVEDRGSAYFVMSTPSVWTAGKVSPGPMGLECAHDCGHDA